MLLRVRKRRLNLALRPFFRLSFMVRRGKDIFCKLRGRELLFGWRPEGGCRAPWPKGGTNGHPLPDPARNIRNRGNEKQLRVPRLCSWRAPDLLRARQQVL